MNLQDPGFERELAGSLNLLARAAPEGPDARKVLASLRRRTLARAGGAAAACSVAALAIGLTLLFQQRSAWRQLENPPRPVQQVMRPRFEPDALCMPSMSLCMPGGLDLARGNLVETGIPAVSIPSIPHVMGNASISLAVPKMTFSLIN
jgi:hypothetical protein